MNRPENKNGSLYDEQNFREHLMSRVAGANREVEQFESLVDVLTPAKAASTGDTRKLEQLQAQKERAEDRMRALLCQFEEAEEAVIAKLASVQKNCGTLSGAVKRLKIERPRAELSDGERRLEEEIRKLREQLRAVQSLIAQIQRVLAKSAGIRSRHGNGKKTAVTGTPASGSHGPAGRNVSDARIGTPTFADEIDGLLARTAQQ